MITPIELQGKTFKTGIGYDKKDVENFLNNLLNDYETLYKDNMELNDKLSVLTEGINYYKTIEKTLQKALVLAEKTAEETKEAAVRQARAIEDEARNQAQLIVVDANNELKRLQQQMTQLIMQYDAYKAQFKHLAAAQCEFLESDSFQIHIANINTIIGKDALNSYNSELNPPASDDSVSGGAASGDTASAIKESTEEDFEFYSLND